MVALTQNLILVLEKRAEIEAGIFVEWIRRARGLGRRSLEIIFHRWLMSVLACLFLDRAAHMVDALRIEEVDRQAFAVHRRMIHKRFHGRRAGRCRIRFCRMLRVGKGGLARWQRRSRLGVKERRSCWAYRVHRGRMRLRRPRLTLTRIMVRPRVSHGRQSPLLSSCQAQVVVETVGGIGSSSLFMCENPKKVMNPRTWR